METWHESLEGGDAELDGAHRQLWALSTAAEEAVARNDPRTTRWKLDEFFELTGAHFAEEERLMRESAYPGADAHLQDHASYLTELHKLRKELGLNGLSPLFRLWFGSRFTGWLRSHVKGMDQSFHRHLRLWKEAQAAAAAAPAPPETPASPATPAPAGAPPAQPGAAKAPA